MSASEFKDKGNKHLQAKEFDEAIAAYTEAINIEPNDKVFFSNRSAAYLSKGDATAALSDAKRCVDLEPTWAKGYSRQGAALHALKRYDEAIAVYSKGLEVAPGDAGLTSGLGEVKKIKEQMDSAPPGGGLGGMFNQSNMLAKLAAHPKFRSKIADPNFVAKLQMLQTNPAAMLQDPEMMEVMSAIIGADREQEPFAPSSSSSSSNANKRPPPAPEPEVILTPEEQAAKDIRDKSNEAKSRGNDLYKAKNFAEALVAYDEALSLDSSNLMVINNKAAVYIEMGDTDQAIKICQELIETSRTMKFPYEDRAKVHQRIAAAYLKREDYPAAIKSYGDAQLEKFDKATERKLKTLELEYKKLQLKQYINPELALEAKERGNAAFRDSNFPLAITEYEEATKRDPTNAAYRNNLAAAYLKMGLFNDAKREVDKSLELDPKYVKAWAKKGDIEFFMKEYHKSMDSYKAGLVLEPDNSLCKQGLMKTGQKINELNYSGEMDAERQAHAMADPEIQNILRDPSVRQVLQDFQENPAHAQKAMSDPHIRSKIERLIAAGVLQAK